MNRLESNGAVLRKASSTSGDSRLAIVEFLLTSDDLAECARGSLEWLGKHAGVRNALCVAVNASRERLVGLAGFGVSHSEIEAFSIDLEERQHPLIAALSRAKPVTVPASLSAAQNHLPAAFRKDSFQAIRLSGVDEENQRTAVGLLLVSPAASGANGDVRWLSELLGHVLNRRFRTRALSEVERALRRERTLLYNILNTVHDPIILTDTEGRLVISNKGAELLFGTREEESEGRRRAVALNNMFLSATLSKQAIEDDPSDLSRELLLVDPVEGSDLFFEFTSTVFSDVHEGTGVVNILRNVSDLRRTTLELEENYRKLRTAEAEVRSERDRLDLIIESVAEPILVTDPEGKILMMNDPAERLFTVPPSATAEATQTVRANDANFSSFVSNLFFLGEGRQHHGGISLTDPEKGMPVPVEAVSAKIISEQGELVGVVTILHDRTEAIEKANLYEQLRRASEVLELKVREATAELVRQNEVLRRQHMELQQASAMKSQFLASVSHELRTPLNSIIGYTRILLQGVSGPVNPQQTANLARVESSARHLLSLINQLLDITRIEAGKMAIKLSAVSMPDLITGVMSEIEPLIAQSKLQVSAQVAPNMPELRSDPEKIRQILLNLLMNALKFTPKGWVRVSVEYLAGRNQVSVSVSDSGIGIAESDYDKIFEDFRRTENSIASGYAGVGLGLAICKRLALLLGGKIGVTSKIAHGSSFTLVLPRDARI